MVCALVVHLVACGSTSGGSGGGGSGGTDTGGPGCSSDVVRVTVCALPTPKPVDQGEPWAFTSPGTVTAVRAPAADEPCFKSNYDHRLGNSDTGDVMIDLTDAAGNMLTVGVATPGLTTGAVAVGDVLDVDFESAQEEWGGTVGHLVIERAGELVVAVGKNEAVGLSVSEGPSECYQEGDLCGHGEFAMTVAVAGHAAVDIANGASAAIGDLTVTNGAYFHNYDTSGGCNFGLSVEYLIGVVPTP